MRVFLIAALVMFVFSMIVATGTTFVTDWNVWLTGGFVALVLDRLVGDRLVS